MTALLEAQNVIREFGGGLFRPPPLRALDDISMRIDTEPPSITAIVGESGSGKTTLARVLLGTMPPTSGEVRYLGQPLHRMTRKQRKEFLRGVQLILQDPFEAYNPFYRVDHLLRIALRRFKLARSRQAVREQIDEALHAVGLRPEDTLGRYPHQLSGGQRQRVMVARALLVRPRLIIADEPVSMVDASLRATILDALRTLTRDYGVSLIYITHDLTTAYQISDNVIVMYRGSVVEAGDANRVARDPQHPYTQLLVSSIPKPDPREPWPEPPEPAPLARQADPAHGCKFTQRCPHAIEACLAAHPPLYQVEAHRLSACYLQRDTAEGERRTISDVFVRPAARTEL